MITFVIMAAVIYFAIVTPYEKFKARKKVEEPEVAASSEELLTEIRDLLATR
ncbi:MAG: MscL family protein [Propionibacteriaceae bacterium]